MELIAIVVGLILLLKGGEWLMKSAVAISLGLNISRFVIGMTVVSFATSAPELIVSIQAAVSGFPDLAFGNVIGSNIANLAFVLAIIIMISPINVGENFYKKDWPMMMGATILFYLFIVFDRELNRYEGIIMVLILLLFLFYIIKFQKNQVNDDIIDEQKLLCAGRHTHEQLPSDCVMMSAAQPIAPHFSQLDQNYFFYCFAMASRYLRCFLWHLFVHTP